MHRTTARGQQSGGLWLVILFAALAGGSARAQTTWQGGTDTWFTAANWNPATVPTTGVAVQIGGGGTAQIAGQAATAGVIDVGADSGGGGIALTSGGSLTFNAQLEVGVSGAGSLLVDDAILNKVPGFWDVYIGNTAAGSLVVQNGGVVNTDHNVLIGLAAAGTATVTGFFSQWNHSGTMTISSISGPSSLLVQDLATVTTGRTILGEISGDTGAVTVNQAGLVINTSAPVPPSGDDALLNVGKSGTGTLTVKNLGVVTVDGGAGKITLAERAGSTGTLNLGDGVSNGGTINAAEIHFGDGNGVINANLNGTFNLTANLTTNLNSFGALNVIKGTVAVSGTIEVTVAKLILPGGTLQILSGGNISGTVSAPGGTVDFHPTDTASASCDISGTGGIIQMTGTGTQNLTGNFSATGAFFVNGGTLNLLGGSTVTGAPQLNVADLVGLNNATFNISGATTSVTAGTTTFGTGGNAAVNVNSGANVGVTSLRVAGSSTSTSTFTLDAGIFQDTGFATIGDAGIATYTIQNGGVATANSVTLGNQASGNGTLALNGAGSTFTVGSGGTIAGGAGIGTINVLGGAHYVTSSLTLGSTAGTGGGGLLVSGAGSLATLTGGLVAGLSGPGTVTIANGGSIDAGGNTLLIARNTDSTGTFNMGDGTLTAAAIQGGRNTSTFGTATLNFNPVGQLTFGTLITGKTSVVVSGPGTAILTAANTYTTGSTTVSGGKLLAHNTTGSATGTSLVAVQSGGIMGGDGFIAGATTVSGILAPGMSAAGLLTFNNNLTLNSVSQTLFEIGGTVRGTGFDAVNVGGIFAAGGTLQIILINAFTPVNGATFDLFDFGSITGTFSTLNLPTNGGALAWDTSALYTTGVVMVNVNPIPEPAAFGLLAGAIGLGLAARRSNRHGAVDPSHG